MPWRPAVPSPTWRSFLRNHMGDTVAVDMFVVATATFRLLYTVIVLGHDRQDHSLRCHPEPDPSPARTSNNRGLPVGYGTSVPAARSGSVICQFFAIASCVMGIKEVVTAARSPWQNAYVERVIGSVRHECLDHVIICDENHLRGVLSSYVHYHHKTRTHLSLAKDCPESRPIHPPTTGKIISFPEVGGLHHRYERRAA